MLYLIWLVPLAAALFWYGHRRRRRILKRYAQPPGLAALLPHNMPRRGVRAVLMLAILLLLAVALSGPQYGYRWQEVERRGVDLIIALDCSRSMQAEDIKPSRLDRAKREIVDLLGMLAGDRVGLVAFAGTAFLQCPLTVDYEAFHLFLKHLGPDFLPVGGTDLTAALTVASQSFDPETATDKAIILITDGGHTGPSDNGLSAAVDAAKGAKIKIFCIGVGGEGGVPVPAAQGGFKKDRHGKIVLSRLDEASLKQISLATGGGYVRSVAGDMDLEAVYQQQIREGMTARALTASRRQIWEDRYQWALGLALALLVMEMILPPPRGATRKRATDRSRAANLILPAALVTGVLLLPPPGHASDAATAAEAYQSGDYEAALKGFIDAQLADPDNPEVLYNVGNAYYKIGDFNTATQHYKDALDKLGDTAGHPDLAAKLHYNQGNALFREGRYPQALESYEKALELAPEDTQAQENLDYLKKMMAQQKQQQPPPSQGEEGSSDEASKEASQDASASNQHGESGDQQGNQEQAPGEQTASSATGQRDQSQETAGEDSQSSAGDQDPGEKERRQFGDEMGPETASQEAAAKGAGQTSGPETESGADPAQTGAAGSDPQMADQMVEQMLNRLEDKPGQALMPAYEGPKVEKDW
jgi:Ca-activated chloride channel family protein